MSNFQFLAEEYPQIYNEVLEAEKFTFSAPRYAALQCRIVLEFGVEWLYDNDPELERPFDTKLASLMYNKAFEASIKPSLFQEINLTRKIGNNAAHGKKVSEREALISLRSVFRFTSYISKYYSENNPSIPDFDESLIPGKLDGVKDKSRKELQNRIDHAEAQLEQFKKEREKLEELIKTNDLLRKQIEAKETNLLFRKEAREEQIIFEEEIPELTPELETRKLYIDVLLKEAGWKDFKKGTDIEHRVIGMPKSVNPTGIGYVDYVLWGDNRLPLAVVEAKHTLHNAEKGQHQASLYADCLEKMTGQRPIIFYSNGFETFIWDDTFYPEREVQGFYTKDELNLLIERRKSRKDIREFEVNTNIVERPYQLEAIKRVGETLVTSLSGNLKGKNRNALLVMATGSGKTRTAAAIVDMMIKCNWAKRVLFLADRNALVTQAKNAFKEHLPHLSAIDLTKETEDLGTRVVFSTYPTIMNKIDSLKDEESRFYGVGHFDVIIIDEAHRSVYKKYGAIFDYFDAILIGLTATPKKEVDHDTYELFGIEDDVPTFAYELTQAVTDKFLVPPKAIKVPIKFVYDGIKYKDLSEEDKRKFEEVFGIEGDEVEIDKGLINKFLFNDDTVDKVLDFVMTNGLKIEGGDKLGKTIIFAKNHNHAIFIQKRFNKNYPEYSGNFLRVIDNYEDKAQDLLEKFCDDKQNQNPQIAVSVDMMDTGVDAPRVVNLVFFKQVRSYTKYWQMIGRGTRLRPDLFAPGKDKKHFLIFDFCDNFGFFGENPDGIEATSTKTLSQNIFEAKLNIILTIRNNSDSTIEEDALAASYANELHAIISTLNEERFEVRKEIRYVVEYKNRERWENLTFGDTSDISEHLSYLSSDVKKDEEMAKRFDLLALRLQLAILMGKASKDTYITQIYQIGKNLLKKRNIPLVAEKIPVLNKITELEFWKDISISTIDEIRKDLRELIKFIEKEKTKIVYTSFEDTLDQKDVAEVEIMPGYSNMQSYRDRVESFIRKNKSHLVIDKLHKNVAITEKELALLESFLFTESIGNKEQYLQEYGDMPLGKFIRSIVGLDIEIVNSLFTSFIQSEKLNATQITFVNKLINYLNKNGTLDKNLLVKPPFNENHEEGIIGVFEDESEVRQLISIIDMVNENAG